MVGAEDASIDGNSFQGAAYIFQKPQAGWPKTGVTLTETAKLVASDGGQHSGFGTAVAIRGDTVAVGAAGANLGEGEAYVFEEPASGWANMTETGQLTSSDVAFGLGTSVAIGGGNIAAGAPAVISGGIQGKVYVYPEPHTGWNNMTEGAQLQSQAGNRWSFGSSVAFDETGRAMLVGAFTGDGAHRQSGAAFVFIKPADLWHTTSHYSYRLFAMDGNGGDGFGYSGAMSGTTVVVGAPFASGNNQKGAA